MPPVDAAGGAGAAPPVDVAPAITASASAPATRHLANRLPSPRPIFTLPSSMVGAIVVGARSSRQHPTAGDPGPRSTSARVGDRARLRALDQLGVLAEHAGRV